MEDTSKDVPIPFDLRKNDRDRRGLPIPFVVYRDVQGTPHFSINNVAAVDEVLAKRLCGLCGKPLKPGQIWFIGGPGSSFLEDGMYIDPFMHEDCGRYSVQVCPFLGARSYAKRVEGRTLKAEDIHADAQLHDNKIAPPRPVFFALTQTAGFTLVDAPDDSGQKYILPDRPWKKVEFWLNSRRITQAEAEGIVTECGIALDQLKWWPA
ncbi:MAG TPA: hypothetical protein VGC16_07700 [Rhizomicrobium sp.]